MLVSKKKFNERLEHLLGSIKFYKSDEDETLKLIENKKLMFIEVKVANK